MPTQCGTSNVDMRSEPYLGAGNSIIELLEQEREAQQKAEAETLSRIRPGVDPRKFVQCGIPRRRTVSDSDLRSRGSSSNIVRAFEVQDGSQVGSSSQAPVGLESERVIDNGKYGKIVIGADGGIKFIPPERGTIWEYPTPEHFLGECKPGDKTGGASRIFDRDGDFITALQDCQKSGGKIIKTIKDGIAVVYPDGRTGSVRKLSTHNGPDGLAPTLEIFNFIDKSKIKIRYRN